ncbi:hypothetical protein EDC39_106127 [Geothermobacter ehrlichii]|uniref:Lipoprotein n=1 Tax=Geothermobacter ehrlichii TaxID=213224 RepID=A0A5D3WI19_9BACT|nr:hypothetical protein [Geothermobacter ehrlichii]TYO98525.1 hypothetical protein EDC39_106127 [Geothermobacter ehrlichii]
MRLLLVSLLLLAVTACSGGRFHLARDEYSARVKTLGVVPILVDAGSFSHPQSAELVALLQKHNRGKAAVLVEKLRSKERYFDVRLVEGDPASLFRRLVAGSRLTGDGGRFYRDYSFSAQGVSEVAADYVVDGLLVVIQSGIERVETRRDRIPVNYLEAPYQSVQVRAVVVLPDGTLAWDYPAQGSATFLDLQYPDFDEAYYNRTDRVKIKFVTLDGLDRALGEVDAGVFGSQKLPKPYADLFDSLTGGLAPLLGGLL